MDYENYIYLVNDKGKFHLSHPLIRTCENIFAYFLTIEVNGGIEPWISFLYNSKDGELAGKVCRLKKYNRDSVYIYWQQDSDNKHSIAFITDRFIEMLQEWKNLRDSDPKGILIVYSISESKFIPVLNGNAFQVYYEEVITHEPHDEYSVKIEQLCIDQEEIKKIPYFSKKNLKSIVILGDKDKHPEYETSYDLFTIEEYLQFVTSIGVEHVKNNLATSGQLYWNDSGTWKKGDPIEFYDDYAKEDEEPLVVPFDKCMHLIDQWSAIEEIPLQKNEVYLFVDDDYNFAMTCVFPSKKVLTTFELEKIQEINEQYLHKQNDVQSIYFTKKDGGFEPTTQFLGNNFDCLALLILRLDNAYWKMGLTDNKSVELEDDNLLLKKDAETIEIIQKSTGNIYTIPKERLYGVIAEWYHAVMQDPIGILLLFKNNRIKIIPDFGRPAPVAKNIDNLCLPAEKLYTPPKLDDKEYAVQTWPIDMSEALIETNIQEAFDYIKTHNVQPIWDPYLKINNFYGYTSDNLLIQFMFDENMHYILSVPIFT